MMQDFKRQMFASNCFSSGTSFWVVRYHAGDEVWENECDWSLLPRKDLVEVRLHCPNGKVAVLGNTQSIGDRAWQIKTALAGLTGRATLGHTIGIHDPHSNYSTSYTWDYTTSSLVGPENSPTPSLIFPVVGIKE